MTQIKSVLSTAASPLQPRQVFRSETRWGRAVLEWPSLDAFLAAAEVESGVHSIPIGEFAGKQIHYDFLVTARPGTVLLCHFHGNAPRGGCNPPFFAGLGVTSSIETSRFIPSDPILVLDANLTLAWHFGCEGIRLQAITVSIVEKLQAILHAPRVAAWGGSGGRVCRNQGRERCAECDCTDLEPANQHCEICPRACKSVSPHRLSDDRHRRLHPFKQRAVSIAVHRGIS